MYRSYTMRGESSNRMICVILNEGVETNVDWSIVENMCKCTVLHGCDTNETMVLDL
jgi:hypothetical protein